MSRNADLIKNTAIIALGKLSTQSLTLLLLPLYTTFLTTKEFGTADLVVTYIVLFAPMITLSLDTAAFRFLIDARNNEVQKRVIVSNIMQMAIAMSIAFALLYALVLTFIEIPFGWVVPATVISVMLSNMFMQFSRGFGDNVKFSVSGLIAGGVMVLANVLFIVILDSGPIGIILALLIGNSVAAGYLFFSLKLYRYISLTNSNMAERKRLLQYSIPMTPNNIAWWLINAADRTIITIFLSVSSSGIYAVASRFPMIYRSLFSYFGLSWNESASIHIDSPDRDSYFSKTINTSIKVFGSLALVMIAAIPLFFSFLVSKEFSEAYNYIPIMIAGALVHSVVGLFGAIYVAKRLTKQITNTTIVAAIISIVLSLAFIQSIGIYAVVISSFVAYLIMMIYRGYDLRKYVTIHYEMNSFAYLALMYIVTATLYYINVPVMNMLNVITVGLFVVVFNLSSVNYIRTKMFAQRRSLTPQQQILEEIEEERI